MKMLVPQWHQIFLRAVGGNQFLRFNDVDMANEGHSELASVPCWYVPTVPRQNLRSDQTL